MAPAGAGWKGGAAMQSVILIAVTVAAIAWEAWAIHKDRKEDDQ